MKKNSGITYNGMELFRFLDSHHENVDDKNFREDAKTYLSNKGMIPKYKDVMEENGEVRRLSINEINIEESHKKFDYYFKIKDMKACIAIILLCKHKIFGLTMREIAEEYNHMCAKTNNPIDERVIYRIRSRLGRMKRTELAKYMNFFPKSNESKARYGIMDKYIDSIKIKQAVAMTKNIIFKSNAEFLRSVNNQNKKVSIPPPQDKKSHDKIELKFEEKEQEDKIIEAGRFSITIKGNINIYLKA